MVSHQVQVVGDHGQLTRLNPLQPAGRIGDHQGLHTAGSKDAHGKRHLLERPPLITMGAALQEGRQRSPACVYDQIARMPLHGTAGKAGNLRIGDDRRRPAPLRDGAPS